MCRIGIMPDILRIRDSLSHCLNRRSPQIKRRRGFNRHYLCQLQSHPRFRRFPPHQSVTESIAVYGQRLSQDR